MEKVNMQAYYIPSSNKGDRLHVLAWSPDEPRAIVQIAHGMAEHIVRYDEFARFLCEHGIAVIGASHLGHGLTARVPEDLGYIAPRDGWEHIIADIDIVRRFALRQWGELPYCLFGHSMGSFVVRDYISHPEAEGLAAAIICGTGHQPGAVVGAGKMIAAITRRFKGERHRSTLLNNISFGSYNSAFKPNRTEYDWLSTNEQSVDKYVADDFCGFCFTVSAFNDLFTGLGRICAKRNIKMISKSLPCYFIAGALDPVGANGAGVRKVAGMMKKCGIRRVETKLYDGCRHEILNEPCRQTVYSDILGFIESAV